MGEHDGFERVIVDGIPITRCRTDDVRLILENALAGGGEPRRLGTVNLDFLRLSRLDPELAEALRTGAHNFADGWPVLALSALSGQPLPERVTGADLTPRICRWAEGRGWRVGFVGGSETTRRVLSTLVPERYGPILAGHWTPDYRGRPVRDPELCSAIRSTGAQVLLVALGCPRQELWLRDNLADSGARVGMGVGGSLDFMAGVQRRAPPVVRALGAEWLFRAASDPRRLARRYWEDLLYLRRLLLERGTGLVEPREAERPPR